MLIVVAGGAAAIFAALRLAPDPRLCDECEQSFPHIQFGHERRARFVSAPTLVTPINAGQLQIGMPDARVVELAGRGLPPPARPGPAWPCVLVWKDISTAQPWIGLVKKATAQSSVPLQVTERITVQRFAPLRWGGGWPMNFYALPIAGHFAALLMTIGKPELSFSQ